MPMFRLPRAITILQGNPVASAAQPGYTASPHFNVNEHSRWVMQASRSVTRAMAQLTWQYAIIPETGTRCRVTGKRSHP